MISPDSQRLVAEARRRIEGLTPIDLSAAIDGETLVVDVREPEERRESGALSGSLSIPRGLIEFSADPGSEHHNREFEVNRRIVLYCDDGARSALAAEVLERMGYWRIAYLDGGLDAWEEEGLAVDPSG